MNWNRKTIVMKSNNSKSWYTIDKIVTDVAGNGPSGSVMAAGDIISYHINISNTGNTNLTNVTVTDSLLGNLTGPVGDNSPTGILNVGEIWIYTGNYTVTQADINSNGGGDGLINNTATVDCDELNPKNDTVEVPIKIAAYIIDKIIIDVAGRGPEGIVSSVGDIITYQINVTNAGDVDLTNVSVNDTLIDNLTGPVESLNPDGILEIGEIWTYSGIYNVTQEVIDNYGTPDEDIDTGMEGDIDNTATVDCDQLDPKSHSAEVPLGTPVYMIDKIITDVAGKGAVGDVTAAGDIISYQVNVSNIGNLDLTNINVTDSLINLTGPLGDNSPTGILNVGETWLYTGNYTVTQADINNTNSEGKGFINNTATVDSTQLDPKNDSENAPIVLPISYNIDKIVTDVASQGLNGNVTAAGQAITYQVNVTNTGQVNLTNVTVTDPLINLTGPTESLTSDLILEIGESWIYNGTYIVNQTDISNNGGGDGFIDNTATVDCDQLASKSKTAQVPIVQISALLINKSASPEIYDSVGDIITYTYNVTNTGNVNITGPINVTDDKVGTLTVTSGNLTPGQSVNGSANYTVNQSDLDNGSVTNAAYANGTFNGANVTSNTDNATVEAVQSPSLITVKIASPETYSTVGENITYTYNVTNTGNVGISGPIKVTDNKTGN